MLVLNDVSRNFGGLQALSKVNLTVSENKIVGLIGPNGAGKTTLINNISGLDHPSSGKITFAGKSLEKAPPHRITRAGIARTYQNIRLFHEMTTLDNLLIAQHLRGKASLLSSIVMTPFFRREEKTLLERANQLIDRFNLNHARDTLAGNLPYGDQRRLEIARALAINPQLILLDEPTETRELGEQILRLKEDGLSVLVIEHDMSLIHQVCDLVYVLNFGQIIADGTPDEIRENEIVIEAYLGRDEDAIL